MSLALVAVPFLVVEWVPSTDLAQHVAQLRLLGQTLAGDETYRIQWSTPYAALYLVLGLPWIALPPLAAAKCGAMLVALIWVSAAHRLAAIFGSPPALAVLASVLVFSHALYWGFLNFLLGFASFVVLVEVCHRWLPQLARRESRSGLLWLGAASLLVYWTHALWYAIALIWLTVVSLGLLVRRRDAFRGLLAAAGAVLPSFLLAVTGYLRLSSSNFSTPPVYAEPLWQRFQPSMLVDAVFGGVRGPLEDVAFWMIVGLVVVVAGLEFSRRRAGEVDVVRWRPELVTLASMMFVLYLVLPSKFVNTIFFHDRWLPIGAMALLLALRAPWLKKRAATVAAAVLLVVFVGLTVRTWSRANDVELSGLGPALEQIPEGASLLGLDYIQDRSTIYKGTPYLQMFAFAQVLHGSRLNFTFAYFAPSLVVFAETPRMTWTPGLEWLPQQVRRSDFAQFDYVLASGGLDVHQRFAREPMLVPVTPDGVWRLYR